MPSAGSLKRERGSITVQSIIKNNIEDTIFTRLFTSIYTCIYMSIYTYDEEIMSKGGEDNEFIW